MDFQTLPFSANKTLIFITENVAEIKVTVFVVNDQSYSLPGGQGDIVPLSFKNLGKIKFFGQ